MLHFILTHIGAAIAVIFWVSIPIGLALEWWDERWQRQATNYTYDETTDTWHKTVPVKYPPKR